MLPGNIDPRRPEKQQRYKPPPASNNAAPGEDLTPDYMNILDPQRKSMLTPRSDRFKVVKIESTEPFKRGRWKCMDFLDQSYAKVFQQNYNNRSSEGRPPSPKNNEPTKIITSGSWSNTASYVDLQSSMLQIFYRQNSLENHNQCSCNGQNVSSIIDCCEENRKYQNHVLMPGMVASSLVGLDFPIELNFTPDNPGHLPLVFKEHLLHSNNNPCIIHHLECCCKTQTSNVDIQKFHQNMSSEQVTIQPTQISNYAQISPDLIQKNLNVSPQELINQNSGINYVQNLIPNDPNKSVRNFQNQQTSVKDEQIIENNNQNGAHKVQQILTQQNYLPSSQTNGSELNKTQYNNNNNPIYVNIQNLTCPQKAVNINDSSTAKNLISDQQITSTSTESPNSVALAASRGQDPQNNKNTLENVCDSTTENMAQNNQNNVMNGNYVSHNLVQNSNETMPTECFQNLVQNLDPNNPNLVQKFVVPNGNMAQNCVSPNGNNVHYIVYSANSNSIQQTTNNNNGNCVPKTNGNTSNQNQNQNFVPSNGNYVQNIVQNTVNTSQNLITNNENVNLIQTNGANNPLVTSKGNSNQNLPQMNNQSNSNPNLMQNSEKITQNVNLYQGQISVVEATSCSYKQSVPQKEVTPIYQNSQNSIQNSLPSNTCIHAFLTEERALVQNTNTNESPGGKLVSNLPVDTKIEALMDLVKKHLKCTVMEDVNVLKHKILELKERIAQLEYENELLKNQYKRNSMQ